MKIQFTVYKTNIMVFKKTHNICDKTKKTSEMMTLMMTFFGIPTKCPMEAGTFCRNDIKQSITPSTSRFFGIVLGDILMEAKIEHNDNVRLN